MGMGLIKRLSITHYSGFADLISFVGVHQGRWNAIAVFILAGLGPFVFPVIHMLISAQLWGRKSVNATGCSCSCWDAVFKGPYESGKRVGYKHVYFNSNTSTMKMWAATLFFFLCLYEAFKHFFTLLFQRRIRWSMGILVLGCLHSQYYAWWAHWNYWNDSFYSMWNHQIFFTFTEGLSYFLVLMNLDKSVDIQPQSMLIIGCIALFHIFAGGVDQFVRNVVYAEGDLNKILRDVLLVSNDLTILILAAFELRRYARHRNRISCFTFLTLTISSNWRLILTLFSAMILFVTIFPS